MNNADMPAMPISEDDASIQDGDNEAYNYTGLTKREYFAGLAMQGFAVYPDNGWAGAESAARSSVEWADALLKELEG